MTLANFKISGKTPSIKEMLKISASKFEICGLINFNILTGILLGPVDFVESRFDISFEISSVDVGEIIISFGFGLLR